MDRIIALIYFNLRKGPICIITQRFETDDIITLNEFHMDGEYTLSAKWLNVHVYYTDLILW